MTLSKILKIFVKELNIVAVGWEPVSCRWFEQSLVLKPWWWLEKGWDFNRSLIKQQWLIVPKSIEAVKAK